MKSTKNQVQSKEMEEPLEMEMHHSEVHREVKVEDNNSVK